MRPSRRAQWWGVGALAALVVVLWPPDQDRSLLMKTVNWLVDPADRLPTLPGPLAIGLDDDADAVTAHDTQTAEYDRLYASSELMRLRLRLKVATDPFGPGTERQVLTVAGVLAALALWRLGVFRTS